MASINGLQNNALIVGTIDGLQTIYATAIYDNGVLLNPNGYVPYTGATGAVNLNGQNLTNVGQLSTTGVNTFSGVSSGTPSTSSSYLALNATNQLVKTSIAPNIPVSAVNTGTWYPTFNATDTTGNVSTLYVDYTGALFYNPVTGTLSSTYFSGIASNATNATNATNVDLVQWTSGGGLIYLVGSSGYTTGYYTLESQNTLTFNPATNTLTASIFSGYATGGVFATTTSNINLIGTDRSVAGNGGLYTQNLLYYNPSTFVLYTQGLNVSGTTISTTPSWTLALDATNNVVRVAVGGNAATLTTTGTSTNTTYYPTFTTNYSTTPAALSYYTDSAASLTYNPSTHTLTTSQLTLSSIASGTPTTYIALNASGQVVSYTPTSGSATTLQTTGTTTNTTYYPVFTTGNSTTPTQLSYYTDSSSTGLSYNPSYDILTCKNVWAPTGSALTLSGNGGGIQPTLTLNSSGGQLTSNLQIGNSLYANTTLNLGITGNTSLLSLSAGTATFAGSILVAGGTVYTPALTSLTLNSAFNWINFQIAGTTYLQMYASYLLMSNGMNAIQTTSQTLLQVAGTNSATAAANFNFENVTPYGTLTTGTAAMNLLCSNATLGGVVASSTNGSIAATYGSSQLAFQTLAPSGISGSAGTLTTYASLSSNGFYGVRPYQVVVFISGSGTMSINGGAGSTAFNNIRAMYVQQVGGGGGGGGAGNPVITPTAGGSTIFGQAGASSTATTTGGNAGVNGTGGTGNMNGQGGGGVSAVPTSTGGVTVSVGTSLQGGFSGGNFYRTDTSIWYGGAGGVAPVFGVPQQWYYTYPQAGGLYGIGYGSGGGAGSGYSGYYFGGTGGGGGGYLESHWQFPYNTPATFNYTIGAGGVAGVCSGTSSTSGVAGNGGAVKIFLFS